MTQSNPVQSNLSTCAVPGLDSALGQSLLQRTRPLEVNPNWSAAVRFVACLTRLHHAQRHDRLPLQGLAMIRLYSVTLSLMAATLVACRAAPAPPTRAELLEKLQQCRDELSKERPPGRLSTCTKIDPWLLNGISRAELAAALGPPTFCRGLSELGSPRGPDCPPELNPGWSFDAIGGTGLELTCETDEKQRCEVLRWIDRSHYQR
jgi:hypothetical protein